MCAYCYTLYFRLLIIWIYSFQLVVVDVVSSYLSREKPFKTSSTSSNLRTKNLWILGLNSLNFYFLQEDHCEDWWTEPHYPVKGSSKPVWGQNPEEKTYSRGLHKLHELFKTIVVVVENTEGVHRSRTLRRAVRNIKSMKIGVDSTKKSEVQF